jgi:2-polyprenyl-3-methyl-5-hydroxy-6-metoxy-1,4-benzoquinol methylase
MMRDTGFSASSRRLSSLFSAQLGLTKNDGFFEKHDQYYLAKLRENIITLNQLFRRPVRILDLGCGRNTLLLNLGDMRHLFTSWGMDASPREIGNRDFFENTIIHDTCSESFSLELNEYRGFFDMIISHDFLEHVRCPEMTHAMIRFVLRENGLAVHSYPTLYDPLLALGRLIPPPLARKIIERLAPDRSELGIFKAFYRKCRGCSNSIRRWFETIGFECREFRDFYGTTYLYSIFPLQWCLDLFYWTAITSNSRLFCSRSVVILRRR